VAFGGRVFGKAGRLQAAIELVPRCQVDTACGHNFLDTSVEWQGALIRSYSPNYHIYSLIEVPRNAVLPLRSRGHGIAQMMVRE
jgi:hypothetical protein